MLGPVKRQCYSAFPMLSTLISMAEPALRTLGWASNLGRERLKKKIWDILQQASAQGLSIDGIRNEFRGQILADVPLAVIWGGAKKKGWLEIRHKWRVATKLPTEKQISNAVYEMVKEGSIRQLGGGHFRV